MKINFQNILSAAMLVFLLPLQGCHDSNDPTPEEKYLTRLSTSWIIDDVTVDDREVTGAFAGMELTVNTKKKFTVKNPVPPIWPADGSFTLLPVSGSSAYSLVRADGIDVTVIDLTETNLTLQLQYVAPDTGGRVKSISGIYEFHFVKK
jgi:hypothetical protein